MFNIPILLFITVVFAVVQISIWNVFPPKLRDIMMVNPVLAFVINLAGSGLISSFTGVASIVGVCNLAASILFGGYAAWYSKKKGIKRVSVRSYKLFKHIPIFPKFMVCYELDGKSWEK